jgi:hypothetical protein
VIFILVTFSKSLLRGLNQVGSCPILEWAEKFNFKKLHGIFSLSSSLSVISYLLLSSSLVLPLLICRPESWGFLYPQINSKRWEGEESQYGFESYSLDQRSLDYKNWFPSIRVLSHCFGLNVKCPPQDHLLNALSLLGIRLKAMHLIYWQRIWLHLSMP